MDNPVKSDAVERSGESPDATAEDIISYGHDQTEIQQSDQEPVDPTAHIQHLVRDEDIAEEDYVEEYDTPVHVSPDLTDPLELMQDPRPPPDNVEDDEEEELVVLDPNHELVRRQQAALTVQLKKELERVNSALKEKLAQDKADTEEMTDLSVETYGCNEKLARLQDKLDYLHQTKAEAMAQHHQALKKLEVAKSQFSCASDQLKKTKANVSQLQSELENLKRSLTFTQEISNELHSNTKAMRNATNKAEAEKSQAEELKLKQDLYVERLTKEMERLTEQVALYNAQTSAQAGETQAAKEALSQAEMEMASLLMAHKQLFQQWNSSLVGMRRRGEAFAAMQEAMRLLEQQLLSLDREIKGYKKTITEEQEQNEILTMQLNRAQMDNATSKSLINQKQTQLEATQAHYSTNLRTLRETERTLAQLTKETAYLESEVNDQRRQFEKESAVRLELEDRIMATMQQRLTHNKAVKCSEKLSEKMTALKKEKITQLWQLENELVAAELESSEVSQHLDNLAFTQKTLDEEITKADRGLSGTQAKISSLLFLISQKQSLIIQLKKKIDHITSATGNEDLSPLQIKADAIKAQLEELEANMNRDHQLWIKKQGTLVGMTQELQTNNNNILQLETEYTCMEQEKIRLENLIEGERREETDIEKNARVLRGDLTKLNTLLSKNKQLSQALEQDNALMQTDFKKKMKEEELASIKMHMKRDKTAEEKERLFNCLVEVERQIMLWEKKIQIVKETYSAVQSVEEQEDNQRMKAEIHRMEVRLTQLMKDRERLLRDSEATVARRETIVLRRESMLRNSNRQTTKGELQRNIQGLQRKIQATHKQVGEYDGLIRELQESQADVSNRLSEKKQQLIDLHGNNFVLEQEFDNLQDTKDKNLFRLVVLQNRAKKLQSVCDGSYKPLSSPESVSSALQSQKERAHTINTILHRVCEEFPQHQGALRRLSLTLAAHSQEGVLEP